MTWTEVNDKLRASLYFLQSTAFGAIGDKLTEGIGILAKLQKEDGLHDYEDIKNAIAISKDKPKFEKYKEFIAVYDEFVRSRINAPAKIDAVQGKAMNTIIAYLVQASKQQDETGALAAWQFILQHWGRVSAFLQQQISLTQINKNLPEIMTQIKNGNTTNHSSSTASTAATVKQNIRKR